MHNLCAGASAMKFPARIVDLSTVACGGCCQMPQSYTWPLPRNLHLQVLIAKQRVQHHAAVAPEQALLDEAVRA